MSAALTTEEMDIIHQLCDKGLERASATLAVAMVTREHSRPSGELIDIVRQYQGLEDRNTASTAVSALRGRGWIEPFDSYGVTLLRQAGDLRQKIADLAEDQGLPERLERLRRSEDPTIKILGNMNDDSVYTSFLELLRQASSEIRLPMLATTPSLEAAEILKKRAADGVKVRVLLGNENVVVKLRGESMRKVCSEAIEGWSNHAKASPNMQVRVCSNADDMLLATCLVIDDRVLRIDIYDPYKQRSLQGTMVEVRAHENMRPNITSIFINAFEQAWNSAYPGSRFKSIARTVSIHWQLAFFFAFSFVCYAIKFDSSTLSILTSSAATFLVNWLVPRAQNFGRSIRILSGD